MQDSSRFFQRYNRIIALSFVGISTIAIFLLFFINTVESQKDKQRLFFELSERADSLNSLLKSILNHLDLMKHQAESFMINPQKPKPKTPYSSALQENPANGFLEIRKPPEGYKLGNMGNLTSLFLAKNIPPNVKDEIEMALSLNPTFEAIQSNIPNAAWIYYTSKSKFINIYPWVPSNVFSLKEEVYTHEFYLDGLPERNPARKPFWTPAYIDEAGKGLMVTAATPVYYKNEFLGTVAIDLTVDFLNSFVSQLADEKGNIVIFNSTEQVLAFPAVISSSDKEVKKLSDVLPKELVSFIPIFKNSFKLKDMAIGNYETYSKTIQNADWTILYFREKSNFLSYIVTPFGLSFITLIIIFFGIFYFINQMITKDFIYPSRALVQYIEQESSSNVAIPIPPIPSAWQIWFEQVSKIFQDNRQLILELKDLLLNLETKVEERTKELQQANEKNETLLLNILPKKIVSELKEKGKSEPVYIPQTTILFSDFVNFSNYASTVKPQELVSELDEFFSVIDMVIAKYGLEKLKTIGDAYMCAGGLPEPNESHVLDTCLAGLEMIHLLEQAKNLKKDSHVWQARVGVHTGPVVAGIIGEKKFAYDIWGNTVNVASRMESAGAPNRLNVSYAVYEKVSEFFEFEARGKIPIKGIGEVEMFFLNRFKSEYSEDDTGRIPNEKFMDYYFSLKSKK
ncbi:MAG: hypothetical protein N3A69_05605 [Leptospiraceae bacterium]|nr:hypothetical protein [Leptospiraceae bacterium]